MIVATHQSNESMVDASSPKPREEEKDYRSESPRGVAVQATITGSSADSSTSPAKPFFIMDWLEEVKPQDLELARQMLTTPKRPERAVSMDGAPLQPVRNEQFASAVDGTSYTTPPKVKMTPFKKRSIAMGNMWNAKGIHKAKQGAWVDALACWENALEIRSQVLGESHIDVANSLNNMGIALGKLERYEEAKTALGQALSIREAHYGKEHTEIAATLHNVGNVLQQAGELKEAIDCFYDSKVLLERLLGEDHVQVARACIAMAQVYSLAREYVDAREAYLDALSIFDRAGVPKNDLEVQTTVSDMKAVERVIFRKGQP